MDTLGVIRSRGWESIAWHSAAGEKQLEDMSDTDQLENHSKILTDSSEHVEDEEREHYEGISPTIAVLDVQRVEELVAYAVLAITACRSIIAVVEVSAEERDEFARPLLTSLSGWWVEAIEFLWLAENLKAAKNAVSICISE